MLAEFLTWWTRQMTGLADPVLARLSAAQPDALLLSAEPSASGMLRLARRRKGRTEMLAELDPAIDDAHLRAQLAATRDRLPLILTTAAPPLLREVTLPAAAEGSLDRFLRYEMDRLTPFEVEAVFFSHRLIGTDRGRGTIRVELTLVPRARLRPVLATLLAAGVTPVALEAHGADGVVRRIPILRDDPDRRAWQRMAWRGALAACALLCVAVACVPVIRQSFALAATADRIAALRPRMEQVERLRQRIAAGSAGSGRLAAARQDATEPLLILGVLTDTLPDDTWLSSLTLRQHRLLIEGRSAAATRLITAMAAESRLRNPAFAAPVLRAETGGEIFSIQADVAP